MAVRTTNLAMAHVGRFAVATESGSVYMLHLNLGRSTLVRLEGMAPAPDRPSLRRDGTVVPLLDIEICRVGHRGRFIIQLRDDGVVTLRDTSPVLSITQIDEPVPDSMHVFNGTVVHIHRVENCLGRSCWIHAPSDHHMRDWPILWLNDRYLAQRLCETHMCGHPDPDDVDFQVLLRGRHPGEVLAHDCCGCCVPRGNAARA